MRRHAQSASAWATALLTGLALLGAAPAAVVRQEDPLRVPSQVTDQVGALGGREGEVDEALAGLQRDTGVQLFVVYVADFSGLNAQEWAEETATQSDLGLDDILLAVATQDRAYAYSVDNQFPLDDAQLAEVARVAIEPALSQSDWAGAAIGAADGYGAVLTGQPIPTPDITAGDPDAGSGGLPGWIWWVLVLLLVGALAVGYLARRATRAGRGAANPGGPTQGGEEFAALSTTDLDKHANRLLVETDDAIKTSEQELGFAEAQFGEAEARSFHEAVEHATMELAAAFQIRQRLDDDAPEDDTTRRALLLDLVRRTDAANDRLDAEVDRFDAMRDLEAKAPGVLADLGRQSAHEATRLSGAEALVEELRGQYAPAAVAAVEGNATQARDRLAFADEQIAAGQAALQSGTASPAVIAARAAEGAVGQARQLLDAVERAHAELAEASGKLAVAIADAEGDLAQAQALAPGAPALAAAAAAARAAVDRARLAAAPDGGVDPLGALRDLETADDALDQALAGVRDEQQRQAKARLQFDQTMLAARATIDAANDFITTRRGAVGAEARTRVATAGQHLDAAHRLAETDPVTALQHAQAAHQLAAEALQLAQRDVAASSQPAGMGGAGGGGNNMAGAILGGILLNTILSGGLGGGGGFGGGGRRGGFNPGSFGGRATGGRRGGGGRF